MTTYEQWLNQVCPDSLADYTNEQIMNTPSEFCPPDWFNPWLLTEREIDEMRDKFEGGSLAWSRFVEKSLPQLDYKTERIKKRDIERLRKVANCGKTLTTKLGKKGLPYHYAPQCKVYDLCPRCRTKREDEHFQRLNALDGCQYLVNQRAETVAQYHQIGIKTYSFKLPNGDDITVIDTKEPIENAQEMSYQVAKTMKSIQISNTKTSGKAGISEPKKEMGIAITVTLLAHQFEATSEIRQRIEAEYLEETKDFQPTSLEVVPALLKKCQAIWFEIVKKHCDTVHVVSTYNLYITEDDLDWTDRKEYIKKWQERASEVRYTPAKSPIST